GRSSSDVLEVAVRKAVAGWAEAVDGADDPLLAVATPEAVRELLYPGDPRKQTRVVVRGPRVMAVRLSALDANAEPPTISVEVDVSGTRYVENRNTAAVVSGSTSRSAKFTEHWTLALAGDDANPWRIVAAGKAAQPAAG